MPNRIVREGIIDSRAINSLSDSGEIFYRRLMSVVDDFGRYEADPELLRSKLFGRQLERWDLNRVRSALAECQKTLTEAGNSILAVYSVSGKKYLQMNNFNQRLRAKTSRCPSPDGHMAVVDEKITPDVPARARSRSSASAWSSSSASASASALPAETFPEAPKPEEKKTLTSISTTTTEQGKTLGLIQAITETTGHTPDRKLIDGIRQRLEVRGLSERDFVADTLPRCKRTKEKPTPAFWLSQAKQFGESPPRETPVARERLPAQCNLCGDSGKAGAEFCVCKTGKLAQQLEEFQASVAAGASGIASGLKKAAQPVSAIPPSSIGSKKVVHK